MNTSEVIALHLYETTVATSRRETPPVFVRRKKHLSGVCQTILFTGMLVVGLILFKIFS